MDVGFCSAMSVIDEKDPTVIRLGSQPNTVDDRNVVRPSQVDEYLSSLIGVEGESFTLNLIGRLQLELLALSILGSEMEKHPSVSDTKTW